MRKLFFFMLAMLISTFAASAQNRTILGMVIDETNDEPLVGATVEPIGGGKATVADIDGKFTLTIPTSVKEVKVSLRRL